MSAASSRNFAESLANAVRRRMAPHTGLQPKQVAYAAGCSPDTFMRWYRGECRMPAEAMGNLARFFASMGDRSFLGEVYGHDVVPLARPAASEIAAELVDILRAKGVAA